MKLSAQKALIEEFLEWLATQGLYVYKDPEAEWAEALLYVDEDKPQLAQRFVRERRKK